ncbi:MAG: hypothetical protein VB050_03270 [Geobacteraceae bacterium]|nr:hypothetical protein [Geobacteraceae bacterium]
MLKQSKMQFLLIAAVTVLACMACMTAPANAATVTLEWGTVPAANDYPVYSMEPGGTPITNPPRVPVMVVPATTGSKGTATLTLPAGAYDFFVTSRNGWGESPPSNIVSTPPLPVTPGNLRVVVTVTTEIQTP